MACHFLLAVLLASSSWVAASSGAAADDVMVPRPTTAAALTFREGYTQLFGDSNLRLHGDGKRVHISLDERTGSGFASQGAYFHGFFSASIKLPSDYAAGVVVAFYMSNGDVYEKTHDELDFEFLGNVRGKEWRVQTNVYGDGSTAVGREERFYVDGTPIREVVRSEAMGAQFPSKPMSLYATIWDGSSWATSGGRYKVEYKYAPYVAEFTDLELRGCASHDRAQPASCEPEGMPARQRAAMERVRARHMTYGYCYDRARYPAPLPECRVGAEAAMYLPSGEARSSDRRRHGKRHRRADSAL
ncbi:probable xyloglucan endotransglucosylase/hydrolase protein 28 isoform X2 [Hordeum vulgare subsp. vulgare]|uniref:probable xyloglucan endotransglucosylase/hydrolase protein 28 isoform X2 n=1 Tax=Hordeum vulgare subsp. vulgare TaxID=112509 RepID=UPI0002952C6E|nr:probable xyloglucan endotransglucosylase/hydrolase protein 28 isoform X2 [Hordeum vulgare subsp. vulgare]